MRIESELAHRWAMWEKLRAAGGPFGVKPGLLRELGIYVGSQGVFFDKERTASVHPGGVTVSVLHTGRVYADDLTADGVIYHYPKTARAAARDASEISATKAAAQLRLPLFVVTPNPAVRETRDVFLGWVEDWDDESQVFLIRFGETRSPLHISNTEPRYEEFKLFEDKKTALRTVSVRQGQQRFKFRALKCYGPECAVCGIGVLELLDAAHLVPKAEGGSDHPANSLILCAIHHRAFDAQLFAIDPSNGRLFFRKRGPDATALHVTRKDLNHLRAQPHNDALLWVWTRWKQSGFEPGL